MNEYCKMFSRFCVVITVFCLFYSNAVLHTNTIFSDDYVNKIDEWLSSINKELQRFNKISASLTWNMMTEEVNESLVKQAEAISTTKMNWKNALCSTKLFVNALTSKQQRMYSLLCRGPKYTAEQTREISKLMDSLTDAYVSAEVCVPKNSWPTTGLQLEVHDGNVCLKGEPDLDKLMSKENLTTDELFWVWKMWHNTVGPRIKQYYPDLVNVLNQAAVSNGYEDIGEVWREELEIPNLENVVNYLYEEIQPLYKMLHAFVRFKLLEKYGSKLVDPTGPIPAHLLGNMWGQDWSALTELLIPKENNLKLNEHIALKNWTIKDMVSNAEDMYVSLGLPKMTEKFWKYSKFQKSSNSSQCHGTAANMFDEDDFRILQCATLSMEDFYVTHHEMGHIQYYMAYSNQPALFQDGANSAFHESIGDSIWIAVMTPQHLHRLGLITDKQLLNKNLDEVLLLQQALAKLPQIPYALLIDKYRWDVFRGKITPDFYNDAFWKMSEQLRGIIPPEPRHEQYFDAGAKFHVPDNTPYIRYFLATILQMEMYKGMCEFTLYGKISKNQEKEIPFPLHRCDLYGSKKAGAQLKSMMKLGASEHWSKALKLLTGKDYISVKPLLEYYKPIYKWLKNYIIANNIPVGW